MPSQDHFIGTFKMHWKDKLTKKELKHLKETDAHTLADVKANVAYQAKNIFPCWDCVEIGRKLGIEVKLTAFLKQKE